MTERARELSRSGQDDIREAILDVLYDAHDSNSGIGAAEISQRAGIFRGLPPEYRLNDGIATNLLYDLKAREKVKRARQSNGRWGWLLSDEEYVNRLNNT